LFSDEILDFKRVLSRVLEDVLLRFDVENGSTEVLEGSSSLRHGESVRDVHDLFEFWEETSGESVAAKFDTFESGHTESGIFFVAHLDESDAISLTSVFVDRDVNVFLVDLELFLVQSGANQADQFRKLVFTNFGHVVDHEVV